MRIILSILLFFCITKSTQAQIPPTYLSLGYNFARSPLRDFNEFIDLYNVNPQKIGNFTFTHGFENMHGLYGIYFGGGLQLGKVNYELNFSRKFNHTFAYYDPANNPNYLRVDIGISVETVEAVFLFPIDYENITISPGVGLGFLSRKLNYRSDKVLMTEPKRTDLVVREKKGSFSIDPMIQFLYTPTEKIPIDFFARFYYQMMFSRMPITTLGLFKGYWTSTEAATKTVSCGNIGLTLGIRMNIPHISLKRKPKPIQEKIIEMPEEIVISGNITDKKNGQPLDAVVTIYRNGKPYKSVISSDGKYSVRVSSNETYVIETKAFGYQLNNESRSIGSKSVEYNIQLEKMAVGQIIALENILFEKASAKLLPESYIELDKLVRFLKTSPTVVIEISGHTSSDGNDSYNLKLSQDRSKSIVDYLVSKGIDSKRLIAKGYGETVPIADNNTEEGRKLNRRVEFKILKN